MVPVDFFLLTQRNIEGNESGFPDRGWNFDHASFFDLMAFLGVTHRMMAVELGYKTYETNLISSDFSWIYECAHDAVVKSLEKKILSLKVLPE